MGTGIRHTAHVRPNMTTVCTALGSFAHALCHGPWDSNTGAQQGVRAWAHA